MSKNLNRHIKSDKAKWAITGIVLVLVVVMLVGMCLQLFGQGKVKPSEWFKKADEPQVEQLIQKINGIQYVQTPRYLSARSVTSALDESEVCRITGISGVSILSEGDELLTTARSKLRIINNLDSSIVGSFDSSVFFESSEKISSATYKVLYALIPENVFDFPDYILDSVEITNGRLSDNATKCKDGYYLVGVGRKMVSPIKGEYNFSTNSDIVFSYSSGNVVPLPPDPEKEGYTFTGWYLDEACTKKYTGTTVTEDTVLYAGWKINTYLVVFDSDGGSAVGQETVDWNTACPLRTPTKTGYTFLGWYLSDGTEYINQPIKENTALKAKWAINRYTVTFNSDGGNIIYDKTVDWNTVVECPTPIKEGYTFKGWFLSDGTQYANQAITSDTTLKAKWEIIKLSVAFDMGGAADIADQVVEYGNSVVLETPMRLGYDFKGWFLPDDTEYTNQPIKENTVIRANWEIKHFTVTFYVDGEVYNEITVDYGTRLKDVADQAEVFSQNVISYRYMNADLPVGELGDMVVVDDMEVEANAPSERDKVIGTIKNNWLSIVLGGVGLIALIAIISAVATRKKRR